MSLRKKVRCLFESKPRTPLDRYRDLREVGLTTFWMIIWLFVAIVCLHMGDPTAIRLLTLLLGGFLSLSMMGMAWWWRDVKKFRRDYKVKISVVRKGVNE